MAEEIDDDPWLDQLREALAEVSESRAEGATTPLPGDGEGIDWSSIEPAADSELPAPTGFNAEPTQETEAPPTPEPESSPEPEPELDLRADPDPVVTVRDDPAPVRDDPAPVRGDAAPGVDTALVLEALSEVANQVGRLAGRIDALEQRADTPAPRRVVGEIDQVELDVVVADAIRHAMTKAQATGAGTVRLETEVRLLEETVGKLNKRVGELLGIATVVNERPESEHAARLADAAESVQAQLAAATEARKAFDESVEKMLRQASEGDGADVAWTEVMFLAHELRSRVDDLDDQQRRAMRDLTDWQAGVDDRLTALRAELVSELRASRDPGA